MRRRVKDPEVGKLVPWTGLAVEFRDAGDSDVRRGSERKGKRCCRGGGQGQGQKGLALLRPGQAPLNLASQASPPPGSR